MQHPARSRRLKTGDDLKDRIHGLVDWKGVFPLHQFLQRAARRQFHGDYWHAVDLFGPEYIDAVWMIDRGRQPPFAEESAFRLL